MARLNGISVILYEPTQVGVDAFNRPLYHDSAVEVDNVLVAPLTSTELLETFNLTGRKAVYQLAIPKGDEHEWTAGRKVSFFGADWKVIAIPTEGIEEMIPLDWNKKVQVERYE